MHSVQRIALALIALLLAAVTAPAGTVAAAPASALQPRAQVAAEDPYPLSIEYLRQQTYPGSDIVIEQKLNPGSNYDRYIASYLSEGLKQYAMLTVPQGAQPATGWPVVVFNHGYIPPTQYRTTERYVAYVDGFARAGYIVFRPDYRGHGSSEGEASSAYGAPDYTVDVLNAVASIKKYPAADPNRIGMWGHSMGGFITLRAMVVSPDIRAGVIWGGVVGSYEDMLTQWRRRSTPPPGTITSGRRGWRTELVEAFGQPADNPAVWKTLSANSYLADLNGPLQLHHARGDASVPVVLSEGLANQGKAAGMPIELYTYAGDNHNISGNFGRAMAASVAFFDRWVKQPVAFRSLARPTLFARQGTINVRGGPGTNYAVVGQLRLGDSLPITGRNSDGSWWQVRTATGAAWVAASVSVAARTAEVPVVAANASNGRSGGG